MAKLILNVILVPIPEMGANGAAIGSVVCHLISFTIGFIILSKNIKIDFKFVKCIVKPIIATAMMTVCSYYTYMALSGIIKERVATIIALGLAVLIYGISIIILKIFEKDEILSLPYGRKLYNMLCTAGIYKKTETHDI